MQVLNFINSVGIPVARIALAITQNIMSTLRPSISQYRSASDMSKQPHTAPILDPSSSMHAALTYPSSAHCKAHFRAPARLPISTHRNDRGGERDGSQPRGSPQSLKVRGPQVHPLFPSSCNPETSCPTPVISEAAHLRGIVGSGGGCEAACSTWSGSARRPSSTPAP